MRVDILFSIKKIFFLFQPSHPHNPAVTPVFIGVSVVRVSVRVSVSALTPSWISLAFASVPLAAAEKETAQYLTLDKASAAHLQDSSDSYD